MRSDVDLSSAWRRHSAPWTCSLSIILIGRQGSEWGNVAGKITTTIIITKKNRWQSHYFISKREEEEEAPRHLRHLNGDGVRPRGRVKEAAAQPQQIIGRFHYFSIMHIAFAAGWGHHRLRTQLGSRTLLRLVAIKTIMLIFIFIWPFAERGTRNEAPGFVLSLRDSNVNEGGSPCRFARSQILFHFLSATAESLFCLPPSHFLLCKVKVSDKINGTYELFIYLFF